MNETGQPDKVEITQVLREMGLVRGDETFSVSRLSGGVSCDVYRVDLPGRTICLKQALPKLRVAAEWRAPSQRTHTEVEWLRLAGTVVPGSAPRILGEIRARHLFAMEYLPPEDFPVWKDRLARGVADAAFAVRVGETVARIHAATAGRADVAGQFDNGAQFHALRLEPYLLYTAEKHAEVAPRIGAIAQGVAAARIALMQGDISPKNILCGPEGPVFLDAETACFGDPAFDLAFCLNHLLLKCIWRPAHSEAYLESFESLKKAYLDGVIWEDADALDTRAAGLLSVFLLARIDGKSPVEYLTDARDKKFVRTTSLALIKHDALSLRGVRDAWQSALLRRS